MVSNGSVSFMSDESKSLSDPFSHHKQSDGEEEKLRVQSGTILNCSQDRNYRRAG